MYIADKFGFGKARGPLLVLLPIRFSIDPSPWGIAASHRVLYSGCGTSVSRLYLGVRH